MACFWNCDCRHIPEILSRTEDGPTIAKWALSFRSVPQNIQEVSHEDKTSRIFKRSVVGRSDFHGSSRWNNGRRLRSCGSTGSPCASTRSSVCSSGRPPACARCRKHGDNPHEPDGIELRAGRFGHRGHPGEDHFPGRTVRHDRTEAFVRRHPTWRPGLGHGHGTDAGPAAATRAGNTPPAAARRTGSSSRALTVFQTGCPPVPDGHPAFVFSSRGILLSGPPGRMIPPELNRNNKRKTLRILRDPARPWNSEDRLQG